LRSEPISQSVNTISEREQSRGRECIARNAPLGGGFCIRRPTNHRVQGGSKPCPACPIRVHHLPVR